MKLEIENKELANCISVLDKLALKGMKSIYRTRLSKKLSSILQRVVEEQREIQKEYFELDDNGNPIIDDEHCKDIDGYVNTMKELTSEKAIVNDGDSQVMLKSVKQSLEDSEDTFSEEEAYGYEYLYTALENAGKDEGKEKSED